MGNSSNSSNQAGVTTIAMIGMIGAFWIVLIGLVVIGITHDGAIVNQLANEAQTIGEFLIGGSTLLGVTHQVLSRPTPGDAASAATPPGAEQMAQAQDTLAAQVTQPTQPLPAQEVTSAA